MPHTVVPSVLISLYVIAIETVIIMNTVFVYSDYYVYSICVQ